MIDLAANVNRIVHHFAIVGVHAPVCLILSSSTLAAAHMVPARSAVASLTTSSPGGTMFASHHSNRFIPLYRKTTDTIPIQNT
jgi:hypothetical protein